MYIFLGDSRGILFRSFLLKILLFFSLLEFIVLLSLRKCRYVGNIHTQVSEPLLQEVFASTGPVEGCKLVRKEKVYSSLCRLVNFLIVPVNLKFLYGRIISLLVFLFSILALTLLVYHYIDISVVFSLCSHHMDSSTTLIADLLH